MEEFSDSYQEYRTQIQSAKKKAFTFCKNLIDALDLSFEGPISNVDLLLLIDDLMEQMSQGVMSHLSQLKRTLKSHPDGDYCVERMVLRNFEIVWSGTLTKIAGKITRLSHLTETNVYQMLNFLEKSVKATINKLFFRIQECLEKD